MATAAAALFCLWGSNAAALSLGRITVQSALGEPLRAEIEIPDINAEESSSLKASVASPETFRAAGLEFNPAMSGLKASLQKRKDGRSYLRLSSDRAISDPFVDMILEASWASGRIVRDYTLLFDPPGLRQAAQAAPTPAQVPAAPPSLSQSVSKPVLVASEVTPVAASPESTPIRPAPSRTNTNIVKPAPVVAKAKAPDAQVGQITVKSGDTASKIAAAVKPANVSLDQMLVALLRANPDAFIRNNVHRVKAGAVITVPTVEQAEAISTVAAGQMIVAQSKDFNDFRRKLATNAPMTQVAMADRKASGAVQAKVEDKKPVTMAPDKLTLSKGLLQGKLAEDQVVKDRSAKDAAGRTAEITKNINELSKLGTASGLAPVSSPASASSKPSNPMAIGVTVATALAPIASASVPVKAASAALPAVSVPVPLPVASVSAPAVAASAAASAPALAPQAASSAVAVPASAAVLAAKPAVSVPVVKRPVPLSTPVSEPDMLDQLLEDPLVPVGAVGLVALLAGLGIYRVRQRKKETQTFNSSFVESHLGPESFFGGSGGQSVDTSDSEVTGASKIFSPSQLDAVDDVDPVAEADVYLAYGRDSQAEEILRDALLTNPTRVAIHQKLLEILAKRPNNRKNFEATATQAFRITKGQGADWDRICELGLSVDPDNALYHPGGQPNNPDGTPSMPAPFDLFSNPATKTSFSATQTDSPEISNTLDLDLDLDFSLDDALSDPEQDSVNQALPIASPEAPDDSPDYANAMEFDLDVPAYAPATAPVQLAKAPETNDAIEFSLPDLEFDLSHLTPTPAPTPPAQAKAEAPSAAPDLGMLEFDLGMPSFDSNFDLEPTSADQAADFADSGDSLETKLALAEEFRAIGDDDGARALIEEVVAEATGDVKVKAQRALSRL